MQSNIITKTAAFTATYSTLVENSRESLVISAVGRDVYVCTGVANLGAATDADAILIPAGTGIVLEPAPKSEVHLRVSVDGNVSYWYT
jgi:hypothetical protein